MTQIDNIVSCLNNKNSYFIELLSRLDKASLLLGTRSNPIFDQCEKECGNTMAEIQPKNSFLKEMSLFDNGFQHALGVLEELIINLESVTTHDI